MAEAVFWAKGRSGMWKGRLHPGGCNAKPTKRGGGRPPRTRVNRRWISRSKKLWGRGLPLSSSFQSKKRTSRVSERVFLVRDSLLIACPNNCICASICSSLAASSSLCEEEEDSEDCDDGEGAFAPPPYCSV